MKTIFLRSSLAAAALCVCAAPAAAQSTNPPINAPTNPPTNPPINPATQSPPASKMSAPGLKEVTVTANPLGADDLVAPTTSYSGEGLLLRSQSTLGETLANTPGVASSYFGPNASRPIIRGQDGDRIRILSNGGASVDASGLSFDHAVPSDPLTIERIEVLRGPGALLYGGSAVGGVVNVIDNRIPREALFDDKGGVSGKVDTSYGTGNRSKNAGFLLETGTNRYALHADVSARSSGDVNAPVDLVCTKPGAPGLARRICNSAADTQQGTAGGSIFFDRGYVGASVTGYRSDYGTVAEDEVNIKMRSNRYGLEGQYRFGGFIESVKAQFSNTDYTHTEFNAGVPQTTFKNKGNELRVEARHAKVGDLQGVVGLQFEGTRFSADGAEAFAPYTRSTNTALFAYEELGQSWGKLTFGGRLERAKAESQGNPTVARFAPNSRSFNLGSYAVGALWKVAPAWQLTSNLSYTERAPKDYELYANGPHGATGAYEEGSAAFTKEQSTNLDVGVAWKQGANRASVSAFVSQFKNYIYLDPTGRTRDAEGNGVGVGATPCAPPDDATSVESGCLADILPEFSYRQVKARFSGLEASGNIRLLDAGQTLDLELRGDLLRAQNLSANEPLPRIAPMRLGATLVFGQGPWTARLGFDQTARQARVPAGQTATDGYTLWNAAVTYRMKTVTPVGGQVLWFARVDNLTNQLAYSATSILTQSAPGKSPLPGRSLKLGLQASF